MLFKDIADLKKTATINQVGLQEIHQKVEATEKAIQELTDTVHGPELGDDLVFPISSISMLEEMANRVSGEPQYRRALVTNSKATLQVAVMTFDSPFP